MPLPQRGPGVDAELVVQRAAGVVERRERVRLAAGVVEREHQLRAEPLAQRMAGDLRLELADQLGAAAEREVGLDPVLERRQPLLLEPRDLRLRERLVGQVGQRRAAPHRKGLPQPFGRGRRVAGVERGAAAGSQRLEAVRVELAGRHPQHIAARLRSQGRRPVAERPANLQHGVLQRLGRGRRRRPAPERVDQPLGRDDLVAVDQQQREQRALPPAGERERRGSVAQLQRTEDPVVHYEPRGDATKRGP